MALAVFVSGVSIGSVPYVSVQQTARQAASCTHIRYVRYTVLCQSGAVVTGRLI